MNEFELWTSSPDDNEDTNAKDYWSTSEFQTRVYGNQPPYYAQQICRLILGLGVSSVLEFGCNAGRNLELLARTAAAADAPVPVRLGLDINADSIAAGVENWGLDLRVGDESTVAAMEPDSWDLAFTVSVIDHVPHPHAALSALVHAARCWLLLLEPHGPYRGRVERYRSTFVEGQDDGEVTPYSYIHDYDDLLGELGMLQVLDIPMPTSLARLGPLYRLRLLTANPDLATALPTELTADGFHRAAVLALLEERRGFAQKRRRLHTRIRELESR